MGCGASKKADATTPAAEAPAAAPAAKEEAPAAAAPKAEEATAAPAAAAEAPKAEEAKPADEEAKPAEEEAKTAEEAPKAEGDAAAGEGEKKDGGLKRGMSFKNKERKPLSTLEKFHSSVRWNKGLDTIKEFLNEDPTLPTGEDERNGNQALHMACQNGHLEITKWLLEECEGVDVNCANKKGQTALHMSIAYDFYEQSQYLLDKGADREAVNGEGNKAIEGIDGDHVGKWVWGSPMHAFKAVETVEQLNAAFDALEGTTEDMLDKLTLVQHGMKLKKSIEEFDNDRFQAIVAKAPAPE